MNRALCNALVASALGGLLLASCTQADVDATPSPTTPTEETTASASVETDDSSEKVLAAYRQFHNDCAKEAKANPLQAVELLKPCATDAYAEYVAKGVLDAYARGEEARGGPIMKPSPPEIVGDTATIRDCWDSSGAGTWRIRDNKQLVRGADKWSTKTTLKNVEGVWKVDTTENASSPEAYCS